jgi:nucleolar complex protein 3
VKSRSHSVHPEVLRVLLSLRIKEINLEKEKEDELKQKKFMKHKQKLLAMSRKERKVLYWHE